MQDWETFHAQAQHGIRSAAIFAPKRRPGIGIAYSAVDGSPRMGGFHRSRSDLSRSESGFAPSLRLQRRRDRRYLAASPGTLDPNGLRPQRIRRRTRRVLGVSGKKMGFSSEERHPLSQQRPLYLERRRLFYR